MTSAFSQHPLASEDFETNGQDLFVTKVEGFILISKGCIVERLDDHFKQREKDEVWIERVSKKKWIILSKDKFIDNRVNVFQIIRRSNARMFVLTAGRYCS